MPQKKERTLTEGSILKSLTTLAIPIIFGNILQTAYQLTDTFWVGRLGTEAVAAVSISFPMIFLMVSFGIGLTMAGTILVSQYKGKKDQAAVNHIATQTMMSIITLSILLSIIGRLLSPSIIQLMGTPPEVYESALSYINISFIGMIFMFIYMGFQSLMRGVGDVKTPVYIVLGTVLLNLVLDPLFIFGYGPIPGYGVAGAALATIGTQSIAAILGIFILQKGTYHIKIQLKDLRPDIPLIKKMGKLGLPASIEQSTRALGMMIMTLLVAQFGILPLAAYGIGNRILSFAIIPTLGLSMATSTLIGQNTGAKKFHRVDTIVRLSTLTGFLFLTGIGIMLFFFAQSIATWFLPGEMDTIRMSTSFIKIMAPTFGFIGIQMALGGVLRGTGNTMTSMMLSIISLWVLQFPLAYVLSHPLGLAQTGIWYAFPLTNVIAAIISMVWIAQGSWKKKQLIQEITLNKKIIQETNIVEGRRS